MRNALASSRHW